MSLSKAFFVPVFGTKKLIMIEIFIHISHSIISIEIVFLIAKTYFYERFGRLLGQQH